MIELCASHFAARHPKRITVANRTSERAQVLAHRFNAQAITLNELPEQLASHDIVVTCTASTLPILGKGMVERAIKARKHRPIWPHLVAVHDRLKRPSMIGLKYAPQSGYLFIGIARDSCVS